MTSGTPTASGGNDTLVSAYDRFAEFYDEVFSPIYLKRYAAFIERVFLSEIAVGATILDMACGSGRLAQWFAQRGFDVIGCDLSAPLLEIARRRVPTARFAHADMRTFAPAQPVHAVICAFDSINHIVEPAQLSDLFRSVGAMLEHCGGSFLFDVNLPSGFAARWRGQQDLRHRERSWSVTSRYDAANAVGHFRLVSPERTPTRIEIVQRAYDHETLVRMLDAAGFGEIAYWDSQDIVDTDPGRGFYRCRRSRD